MDGLAYSLVLDTSEQLEREGFTRGADVHLNACCHFPLWRRNGETAVQAVSGCAGCLSAIRQVLANREKASCLFGDGGHPDTTVMIVLQHRTDPDAPRA
jgi:hypothetical protein